MDTSPEEPLLGGNSASTVVRVGETVRRPSHAFTPSVNALLAHLNEIGLSGVPRFLGIDALGRQVLRYVDGHVDPDPRDLDLEDLARVGQLIRSLHDGAATFVEPAHAAWQVLIASRDPALICHHDLAPWNLVRGPDGFTFIDWDGAGPGSRLEDLAYAAHGFVPLSPRADLALEEAARRLRALVDGYGLDELERDELAGLLVERAHSMYELLRRSALERTEPWATLFHEGHGARWLDDANFIRAHEPRWRRALRRDH